MRIFTGTLAECEELAELVDRAKGYPRKFGTRGPAGFHAPVPETWDGTGPTPPGWIASHEAVWSDGSTAVYRLEDSTADELAASGLLTAAEKSRAATFRTRRSDVADRNAFAGREQRPRPARSRAQIGQDNR